jgi:uncharacterized damage-inducible protein DinB
MTRSLTRTLAAALLLVPTSVTAQTANPLMDSVKAQFGMVKGVLLKTAEKVPEPIWSFKPTPEVRTFGQIVGHIADANLAICGAAVGDKATPLHAEKTMTTKAALSKALADSVAYCDKVIAAMDDKKGLETTKFFVGGVQARAMVLAFNTAHDYEHYGNLVTYMRINKIVPPSSEGSSGMD